MLNFSALTDPLVPQDIADFKATQSSTSVAWKVVGIVAAVIFGSIIISSLLLVALFSDGPGEKITALVVVSIAVGIGLLAWLASRAQTERMARVYKFSKQNGATFTAAILNPSEVGVIFGEGHSRSAYSVVDFPGGLRVANYQYTTGSGKNQTTHHWTYARMPLERHVPNMMIDAKSNNLFRRFSNLPVTYKKAQAAKINGEFDDMYTLYAPEDYDLDTYYLLTPDVLAALVDAKGRYDIEVVDNNIYFYAQANVNLAKQQSWESILSVVNPVSKEFGEQADYYADDKAGVPRAADVIAPQGRRLRRSATPVVIVTIVIILYYVIMFIADLSK